MKIALLTLGCKLNFAETSTYQRGFVSHGLEVVPWNEKADVYLVNTCSVTQHSDNKCRNIIRKCHRVSPDAVIVVTGCYAELRGEEVKAIEGVKLVFGAKEKSRVVPDTMAYLKGENPVHEDNSPKASMPERYRGISSTIMAAHSQGDRTRSFLKVQDGCNNFCAYCTVPFARGESRNIPIASLVEQAHEIAASGTKEIVLTGVNTGDFGKTTGESFLDLLKALNEVDGIERYRISSIEPNLITDPIIEWIASGTKFMPHFHIPLQVGSDLLLKKVGRRYTTEEFARRIETIREKMEGPGKLPVFFGIDVIVGLPGETDALFDETVSFLSERIRPVYLHIFPYSKRPGTKAATMPDQVQDSIKTARVKVLEELCERLNADFTGMCRGLETEVLWESTCHEGMMSGYTPNYIRVSAPYDPEKVGTIGPFIIGEGSIGEEL
ncbi:MAG: tRNA (N(6)-L-threonylcarbamoyladenosine(37)-C(2))-methylthiotransferase MtaB [Bacteroidales bacterium]|nr:tRNA (N(6)-L-threonylcarbamoyladenosine(37)-C(2))-methylthiotransferase MtaB [Bacteroidales bacterium]